MFFFAPLKRLFLFGKCGLCAVGRRAMCFIARGLPRTAGSVRALVLLQLHRSSTKRPLPCILPVDENHDVLPPLRSRRCTCTLRKLTRS
jgi:hypothetical protein